MMDQFLNSIPNEDKQPTLHVISQKKMTILNNMDIQSHLGLNFQQLNDTEFVNELYKDKLKDEFFSCSQKLKAIFKLILKGDDFASELLLCNILSTVYQRTPDGVILGPFQINLNGVNSRQAKQITDLLHNILHLQMDLIITTETLSNMRL